MFLLFFFCPADHVPDWQPRVLLGMVEARSVNVKKTTTTTHTQADTKYTHTPAKWETGETWVERRKYVEKKGLVQ